MLENVKHVLLILSGKGGVGKSTTCTQIALALVDRGYKVGILDIDLCGPSIPYLLNLSDSDVHKSEEGWIPVYSSNTSNLSVMSIGFLLKDKNNSVVWRGPKKTSMIKQFLTDVCWGDLDYLIIDTPPGTSDEHMTIAENLKNVQCDGAIIITTPQRVSVDDVLREITFCKKSGIPIVGLIENMSGFTCPSCKNCYNIFSKGGGEALADLVHVPLLGSLPADPQIGKIIGKSCIETLPSSEYSKAFNEIVNKIIK